MREKGMVGKRNAIRLAQEMLADELYILDTETTGLGPADQICQIAIINHTGDVVLDSLVRPTRHINPKAMEVHGITDADAADAPTIADVLTEEIFELLTIDRVGIYNAAFDLRLLRQSIAQCNDYWGRLREAGETLGLTPVKPFPQQLPEDTVKEREGITCIMDLYAQYYGAQQSLLKAVEQCRLSWNGDAHSALADARATLEVLKHMASSVD